MGANQHWGEDAFADVRQAFSMHWPNLHEEALRSIEEQLEGALQVATNYQGNYTRLQEQYQAARDVLVRLRQWDMMVGGIGADGEHHEATADAPYWRDQIDRALSFPAKEPSDA